MGTIKGLLDRNREWASSVEEENPGFFKSLSRQQKPDYLWIGCSDSRVPETEITGSAVYVGRAIAHGFSPGSMKFVMSNSQGNREPWEYPTFSPFTQTKAAELIPAK